MSNLNTILGVPADTILSDDWVPTPENERDLIAWAQKYAGAAIDMIEDDFADLAEGADPTEKQCLLTGLATGLTLASVYLAHNLFVPEVSPVRATYLALLHGQAATDVAKRAHLASPD